MDNVVTEDVSASGLSLVADKPHGLATGDRMEIRLHARVEGLDSLNTLIMATNAVVTRTDEVRAALRFEAPLAY